MTGEEMAEKTLEQMKIVELNESIAKLPDKVDLTAAQLKARFDANPTQIKDAFDDLITFLQNANPGHSAASYIGSEEIEGVGGHTNVRDQMVNIKGQLNSLALGDIPDASITSAKLAFGAAVGAIAPGEIPAGKLAAGAAADNLADGSILRAKLEAAVQQAMFSPGDLKWRAANESEIPGWIKCDGSAFLKSEYPALYAAIGDAFSTANPATPAGSFRVPNLKGRAVVAFDNEQSEFNLMGTRAGEKMQGLTENQLPAHNHTQNPHTHGNQPHNHQTYSTYAFRIPSSGTPAYATDNHMGSYNGENWVSAGAISIDYATATNNSVGRGDKHNNLQPYIVLQVYIKT